MCQLKVRMMHDGGDEFIARDVASLDIQGDSVIVVPLFDDPITVSHAAIAHIDSMNGIVTLREAAP